MPMPLFAALLGSALSPRSLAAAAKTDPAPLRVEASDDWLGIDGNWSSVALVLGDSETQKIRVAVSTSIPEIWVVQNGTCSTSATCTYDRGGFYNASRSDSWASLGSRPLGLTYTGDGGEGDYALETISLYHSEDQSTTPLSRQLVAGLNDTHHSNGYLGLGVMTETINGRQVKSPISTLVEDEGIIESHSYGFTAGAYYAGAPLSLTLGGYDSSRFEPHDTSFTLNPSNRRPEALLRGVTASVSNLSNAPTDWASSSMAMSSFNESAVAMIDSSTPYLWLPPAVCDRFAAGLNLTWDDNFNLYTYGDDANRERFLASGLSVTFSLSSADNTDGSAHPLADQGVVNITLPAKAFDHALQYPFMGLIDEGAAPVPYFPLKKAADGGSIVLGRTFLQESYLITNYETGSFSTSQAKHTKQASGDTTSIMNIAASALSPFPGNPESTGDSKWTKGQKAGIIVGLCVVLVILTSSGWWFRHRRKKQKLARARARSTGPEDFKDSDSTIDSCTLKSPVDKLRNKFPDKYPKKQQRKGLTGGPTQESKILDGTADDQYAGEFEIPIMKMPTRREANMEGTIDFRTIGSEIGWEAPYQSTDLYDTEQQTPRQYHDQSPYFTSTLNSPAVYGQDEEETRAVPHFSPSSEWDAQLESPVLGQQQVQTMPVLSSSGYDRSDHRSPLPAPIRTYGSLKRDLDRMTHETFNGPRTLNNPPPTTGGTEGRLANRIANLQPTDAYAATYNPIHLDSPRTSPRASLNFKRHSTQSAATNRRSRSFSVGSTVPPPSPSYQRSTIDGSQVVCLGPLTEDVRRHYESLRAMPPPPSQHFSMGGASHAFTLPTIPLGMASKRQSTVESLGSNFTIEEEERNADERAAGILSRIDDLIHVPQPAERRFSWEQ